MTSKDKQDLSCSFCGEGRRDEVDSLIAGPTVYICGWCVELCNDILAEAFEREGKEKPSAVDPVSTSPERGRHHGGLSCSFCGKGQREVRILIAAPTIYICDECVKVCNDILIQQLERDISRLWQRGE